jgi:hypothetical protein
VKAGTVIHSAAYLEHAVYSQLSDDAAGLGLCGPDLVASAPEMGRNIALVRALVEQPAREGRPASEVLADRLPP